MFPDTKIVNKNDISKYFNDLFSKNTKIFLPGFESFGTELAHIGMGNDGIKKPEGISFGQTTNNMIMDCVSQEFPS